uniref:Uncharacterized protein n=1 Tax=Tanacetum cinerariifolium TaxID=118510 RepID=A0A6L2NFZ3_TANCI|nr:hypothetical protein [Tanacetum cinerariifolium]
MVQAPKEMGKILTDIQDTPILTQPSSSQPQMKHKFKRKQRKETVVPHIEPQTKEHIPTPSHDPLPSGKDRMQLSDLMEICTKLFDKVLSLEQIKTNQAAKIDKLKKIVKKLEGIKKKRTHRLKRLYKVGLTARVESSKEEEAGDHVKQDATVAEKEVSVAADKVVTTTESVKAKPGAREVIVQELSKYRTTSSSQPSKLPQAKDKEVARKLDAQMKAKMEKEERIAKEKDEANRVMIKEWDDVQATINADSSKRVGNEIEKESAKRHRLEKEDDTTELKRCLEIVPKDDDDVIFKAKPLSFKSPTIVYYKIYKEGKKSYFKIIRADENSQNYLTFRTMFKNFNREDLEVLRSIVKKRFKKTKPVNDMDNLLFQTLKTMFEHHVEDNIWKYQQGVVKVHNWKLTIPVECIMLQHRIWCIISWLRRCPHLQTIYYINYGKMRGSKLIIRWRWLIIFLD